jgi:Xaa-Pro aminopeptidase
VADRHDESRIAPQLERRRSAAAEAWQLADEVVLVGAGTPIPVPGRGDLTYPFRAHSDYYYLTDRDQPGAVLAFDPREGWIAFHPPVDERAVIWISPEVEEMQGPTTDALPDWLATRARRPVACLGVPAQDVGCDADLSRELEVALASVRRRKDEVELDRMRAAERATRAAFRVVVPLLREGVTERAAQIELEAEAFRAGADGMAYETIIASGPNSAALHFAPTSRPMRAGELVLIDAGAEYRRYAADITRTYPVGGALAPEQQELHSLVRTAELAAIEHCLPGTEWRDVHLTAARVLAEGLVSFGILRGEPDSLIESGAVWLFFPHGIGHLVGLGIRDAGPVLADRGEDPPPFPNLRIDLPLEPGMVVTVEPGIYFIAALLQDAERRRRHSDEVSWDRVDRMLDFGGIRIEDDVLITDTGREVITEDVPLLDPA